MQGHQTNTIVGPLPMNSGEDLTGKEGYLVTLANNSGTPEVKLLAAITEHASFMVLDGAALDKDSGVIPLNADSQYRGVLDGTCVPTDVLVQADPGTAADKGKLRKLPAAADTYIVEGIAEETGVDGQHILFRPTRKGESIVVV